MTIRRIIYQGVVITTATIGAVAPTTPKTSGIQNFDPPKFGRQFKATQEPIVQSFVTGAVNRSVPDGDGEFRLSLIRKRSPVHLYQDVANAPQGYVANTPITAGVQAFDYQSLKRSFRFLDQINTSQFAAASTSIQAIGFDPVVASKAKAQFDVTSKGQTTVAAATPITAGLQDFDFQFQKPWKPSNQQFTSFAPLGAITVTATPITAGLQDFAPWLFVKPFKANLQQDHVLAPFGYIANTPITSGLQDLVPVLFQRPFKSVLFQDIFSIPYGYVANTPNTAGLQDFSPLLQKGFKATLQQLDAITSTGTFVPANTPITSGLQDFSPLLQKPFKASLQQHEVNTPSGTYVVANTPITGGIQGFDFEYKKSFNASLQALGTWGASEIVVASTPTSFQFALLDMKPLRQFFPAYQQQFVAAQMLGDVPAPPAVVEVKYFPFIANVGTMMCR